MVEINPLTLKNMMSPTTKLSYIINTARSNNWNIVGFYNESNKIVLHKGEDVKMVINLSNNNIVTTLKHPNYPGITKLKRMDVSEEDIKNILTNPRMHTDKGMYIEDRISDLETKAIPGFRDKYIISANGTIKNILTNKEIKHTIVQGVPMVALSYYRKNPMRIAKKHFRVARLLMDAFKPLEASKEKYIIRYKDGDSRNVNVNNLFWKRFSRVPTYGQLSLFDE